MHRLSVLRQAVEQLGFHFHFRKHLTVFFEKCHAELQFLSVHDFALPPRRHTAPGLSFSKMANMLLFGTRF